MPPICHFKTSLILQTIFQDAILKLLKKTENRVSILHARSFLFILVYISFDNMLNTGLEILSLLESSEAKINYFKKAQKFQSHELGLSDKM